MAFSALCLHFTVLLPFALKCPKPDPSRCFVNLPVPGAVPSQVPLLPWGQSLRAQGVVTPHLP